MSDVSILIVEDEFIVAADLESRLWRLGYSVVGSTDTGEEAVALARKHRPSLVMMDIHLAGAMDGIEAANAIRTECDLPVVFLTAHSDADTIERAGQTEAFGYILKPFDERELRTHVRMALYKHAAEQRLREADRHKTEFIAMLSHELRNPLAPIRNSLYILERAAPGSEQAKRAQAVIDRQVRHMTRLVDDLLDITRIARGKIQLQRQRVELGELVRRTIEDHRTELLANGCELAVAIAEEALWAEVDATRIAQVIGNLLQNAAKFTPRGGKIAVSIARDDDAAIIRVEDTGIGIAADMLQKIFEPFTQADNSLARSWGGLGLGLAFVKGLVEMHGGSVSAASEGAGKGSTFTVSLPLLTAEAPRTTGATAEEVSAAACCSAPEPRPAAEAIKQ